MPEPPAKPGGKGAPSDAQMYQRLVGALRDQRLAPGTRLAEDKLGQVFGVSRTRVRQLLIRLAAQQLVTLVPNAGARVASPTAAEALEVFAVRRLVEPALVAGFVQHASAADLRSLKHYIVEEESARHQGDRGGAIRAAGNFHLCVADHAGNQTLARLMHELVPRTALVLMRFGPVVVGEPPSPRSASAISCQCTEHRALWAALRLRDAAEAQRSMLQHLERLESQLVFASPEANAPDLAHMLAEPMAQAT